MALEKIRTYREKAENSCRCSSSPGSAALAAKSTNQIPHSVARLTPYMATRTTRMVKRFPLRVRVNCAVSNPVFRKVIYLCWRLEQLAGNSD